MKEKSFKKGFKKRLFSVVLALAMVVTLLPMNSITAKAATTDCSCGHPYGMHQPAFMGGGCNMCNDRGESCSGFDGTHTHDLTDWLKNADNHWKDCQSNDMLCMETCAQNGEMYPLYEGPHNWSDGVCIVCGYTCLHPGMTAANATCGKCGKANPDYAPTHTHGS
ncbi:MAG: hypothetical protein MJ134_08370 [Lachnospiraceae bacterium]|nr:hypothetical protein [Lachnospiraceae bacterium]